MAPELSLGEHSKRKNLWKDGLLCDTNGPWYPRTAENKKLLINPKHTNHYHWTSITVLHSIRAVFSATRHETSEENEGWLRSRQAVVLAPPPCAFISPS